MKSIICASKVKENLLINITNSVNCAFNHIHEIDAFGEGTILLKKKRLEETNLAFQSEDGG